MKEDYILKKYGGGRRKKVKERRMFMPTIFL